MGCSNVGASFQATTRRRYVLGARTGARHLCTKPFLERKNQSSYAVSRVKLATYRFWLLGPGIFLRQQRISSARKKVTVVRSHINLIRSISIDLVQMLCSTRAWCWNWRHRMHRRWSSFWRQQLAWREEINSKYYNTMQRTYIWRTGINWSFSYCHSECQDGSEWQDFGLRVDM